MATKPLPSQEVLRQLLDYDPKTGTLTWRHRSTARPQWNGRFAGKPAFTATVTGYRCGSVEDTLYLAHRLIWKMVHGIDPDHIDHINGDRQDNRLANLRDVTATANVRNAKRPKHNTSGFIGISWDRSRSQWEAHITLADRKKHIGRFSCIGQAIAARKEAQRRHGFHENHGRAA